MDRGAWQAAVHGVAKSGTQLSDSLHFTYSQGNEIKRCLYLSRKTELQFLCI